MELQSPIQTSHSIGDDLGADMKAMVVHTASSPAHRDQRMSTSGCVVTSWQVDLWAYRSRRRTRVVRNTSEAVLLEYWDRSLCNVCVRRSGCGFVFVAPVRAEENGVYFSSAHVICRMEVNKHALSLDIALVV